MENEGIMNRAMQISITLEVHVKDLFDRSDGRHSKDLAYCRKQAAFQHQKASEYIIHIDTDESDEDDFVILGMKSSGCSNEFMEIYKKAKKLGANRLLLYT